MNNSQFRSFAHQGPPAQSSNSTDSGNGFRKPMLGSKSRPSIPMTPRALAGRSPKDSFSRQVAELKRNGNEEPPPKRFKSSAAPKGTILPAGYTDRTKTYNDENAETSHDPKLKRLKALEEMLKLQQIDQETFEQLRNQIGIGGDLSSTHLVKGLDRKLLERVRRGEDVTKSSDPTAQDTEKEIQETENVEDELEKALEKDISPQAKQNNKEREGDAHRADADTQPLQTISRDEILRRLKTDRKNIKTSLEPVAVPQPVSKAPARTQGGGFRKVTAPDKPGRKKYTEVVNGRRREVLEITDKETGKVKRKTRWIDAEAPSNEILGGDVMGMELPEAILARQRAVEEERKRVAEAEDDADIFAGADEYNPLAGIESDESENEQNQNDAASTDPADSSQKHAQVPDLPTSPTTKSSRPRNYFNTSSKTEEQTDDKSATHDASIIAAIKRAAQIRQRQENTTQATNDDLQSTNDNADQDLDSATLAKRRAFLAKLKERDRQDAMDMDMEFGESRMGDEDEEGEEGDKLSEWKGNAFGDVDDDDEDEVRAKKGGGGGRKRKPKKRKGDKNSFNDVMNVLEGRKNA